MRHDQGGAGEHNDIEDIMGDTVTGREVVDGIEGAFVVAAETLDQTLTGLATSSSLRRTCSARTFDG